MFEEDERYAAASSPETDSAWDNLMPGKVYSQKLSGRCISNNSWLNITSWTRFHSCRKLWKIWASTRITISKWTRSIFGFCIPPTPLSGNISFSSLSNSPKPPANTLRAWSANHTTRCLWEFVRTSTVTKISQTQRPKNRKKNIPPTVSIIYDKQWCVLQTWLSNGQWRCRMETLRLQLMGGVSLISVEIGNKFWSGWESIGVR